MNTHPKLMCIFAHPDDESMGMGATLAKAAANGIEISLVCATRGEKGWYGPPGDYPGALTLGQTREAELHQAARVLGIRRVDFLDFIDGELNQVSPRDALPKIVALIREVRPQVVISFGPDGYYGHPDHIAISQLTTAALVTAADPFTSAAGLSPHRVDKFYYMVCSPRIGQAIQDLFGEITIEVNASLRQVVIWPEWAVTTTVHAEEFTPTAAQAIYCHRSQLPSRPGIEQLSQAQIGRISGQGAFYRVYSLVNPGQEREDDLFTGL
jgi:LmbE family N-acetylglucosaminyl deacetylase